MYMKKNGRMTYKSNRRPNFKRNNNFSPKGRSKGNVSQQYNKYLKLAKEAFTSGDRIQSEYYYQFTDHYFRLMAELGINLDENNTEDAKQSNTEANSNESSAERNENVKESEESIESIPFIAEPTKEKRTRSVK